MLVITYLFQFEIPVVYTISVICKDSFKMIKLQWNNCQGLQVFKEKVCTLVIITSFLRRPMAGSKLGLAGWLPHVYDKLNALIVLSKVQHANIT